MQLTFMGASATIVYSWNLVSPKSASCSVLRTYTRCHRKNEKLPSGFAIITSDKREKIFGKETEVAVGHGECVKTTNYLARGRKEPCWV